MDDQRFQALMGLVQPQDMTSQQALASQLRGQHDLGQLYSLSPSLGNFGRSMQESAMDTAIRAGNRRQQGLTRARQAEQDRLAAEQQRLENQRYIDELAREDRLRADKLAREDALAGTERQQALDDAAAKRAHQIAMQEMKDTAAIQRARILAVARSKAAGGAGKMGATEKRNYRTATNAANTIPEVLKQVEAAPGAFGETKDLTAYMPEWTPNLILEGTKNVQADMLSDPEQQARQAVLNRAYQTINALAGAALSVHEKTRIEQFLPAPNDNVRTIRNKLIGALQEARRIHQSFDMYSDYEALPEIDIDLDSAAVLGEANQGEAAPPAGSIAERKAVIDAEIEALEAELE